MEKSNKFKIIIGLFYLTIISLFMYFLFSKISFEDISSIKIIQSNVNELNIVKSNNLITVILFFCIFTILWVLLLGFGTPVALVGGFIFGKWLGTILITLSLSTGDIILKHFIKIVKIDFLKKKLSTKFKYLVKDVLQLLIMIIF